MNRSTLIMVVLFVVLLGAWLLSQQSTTIEGPPAFAVDGFVEGVSFQDIKILNKDEESPYTRFVVERKGEKVVMEQLPGQEKVKAGERKWKAVRTGDDGQNLETWGQAYRVRLWNQALALSFRSSYSFEASDAELAEYGLDPDKAVTFTAEGGGRKVRLTVGKVDKTGEGDTDATTWIMNPDLPKVVYQVAGRDLRTELAKPWKDMRDRKLFDWNLARIDRVELINPADTRTAKVIMTRPPLTEEQNKELAEGKEWKEVRKADVGWTIAEPKGYPPGNIGDWLESLERMQATDYRPFTDGKLPADSGLGKDKGVRVTVSGGDKSDTLVIGGKSDNKEGDVWVQRVGDKELYLVASWSSDQCIKNLDGVRDLRLLGDLKAAGSDVLELTGVKGKLRATRKDKKWTGTAEIDGKKVDEFLTDLDSVRVEYQSAMTRSAAGLDKPAFRYTFAAGGKSITLLVSAKKGEDTYGALGEDGDVFKFQSWNADRLRKGPIDFADKRLVAFFQGEVKGVVIQPPEGKASTLNRGPDGRWQLAGKPDEKLKDAAIDGMIGAAVELNYDSKISSQKLSDFGLHKGYYSVEMQLNLGRREEIRVSTKETDGKVHVSVHRGGKLVQIGLLPIMSANSIKKTLADLKD